MLNFLRFFLFFNIALRAEIPEQYFLQWEKTLPPTVKFFFHHPANKFICDPMKGVVKDKFSNYDLVIFSNFLSKLEKYNFFWEFSFIIHTLEKKEPQELEQFLKSSVLLDCLPRLLQIFNIRDYFVDNCKKYLNCKTLITQPEDLVKDFVMHLLKINYGFSSGQSALCKNLLEKMPIENIAYLIQSDQIRDCFGGLAVFLGNIFHAETKDQILINCQKYLPELFEKNCAYSSLDFGVEQSQNIFAVSPIFWDCGYRIIKKPAMGSDSSFFPGLELASNPEEERSSTAPATKRRKTSS